MNLQQVGICKRVHRSDMYKDRASFFREGSVELNQDVLGRIKQAASVEVSSKPLGYMLLQVQSARYSVEDSLGPPWRCS